MNLEYVRNICIIGHGPSAFEIPKLSKLIDGSQCVIRMVECDWQDPDVYGHKYDIGVYSQGPSETLLHQAKRKPSFEYWRYEVSSIIGQRTDSFTNARGRRVRNLRESVWRHCDSQRHHVSRGTATILASISLMPNIEQIQLVGFDNINAGKFHEHHHPEQLQNYLMEKLRRETKKNTHDWKYERKLVQRKAKEKVVFLHANNFTTI